MYKNKNKKKKMRKIEEVLTFNDFKKVNEGFSQSFIERGIQFIEKISYLFKNIQLSDEQIQNFINSPNLKQTISDDKEYLSQIKRVLDRNEDIIEPAYEEEFGIKEEFLCSILISVGIMVFFYYAQRRGWIDKLLRKIDPKMDSRSGGYPGDNFGSGKKKSWKEKIGLAPPKAKILPKPSIKQGNNKIDAILDKMGKVGYNGLSQDEKDYLNKMKKNESSIYEEEKYICNTCGHSVLESKFRGFFGKSLKCPECKSDDVELERKPPLEPHWF